MQALANNPTPENFLTLDASSLPIVALCFEIFSPAPNGPNGERRVQLHQQRAARLFCPRCKVGPLPADQAEAERRSVLTFVLTPLAWARILTELAASGAFHENCASLPAWDARMIRLNFTNPTNMDIVAADWGFAAPFAIPQGGGAANQRRRDELKPLEFVHAASIASLARPSTPVPLLVPAILAGAMGDVGTVEARARASGDARLVAGALKAAIGDADTDRLAASVYKTIAGRRLPELWRAHSTNTTAQREDLEAGLDWRDPLSREAVEIARVFRLDNGSAPPPAAHRPARPPIATTPVGTDLSPVIQLGADRPSPLSPQASEEPLGGHPSRDKIAGIIISGPTPAHPPEPMRSGKRIVHRPQEGINLGLISPN